MAAIFGAQPAAGSLAAGRHLRRIGAEVERALEKRGAVGGHFNGRSLLGTVLGAIVPKTARAASSALPDSEATQFTSILLFSGVGLLISLTIVILRMNGVF